MRRPVIDLSAAQQPLLNIASLGRGHRPLTPAQRAHICRTVANVPEVVVKVSGGAPSLRGGLNRTSHTSVVTVTWQSSWMTARASQAKTSRRQS